MFKAFEFCIPTGRKAVRSGPDWIHEIKYDGYRLRVERDGKRGGIRNARNPAFSLAAIWRDLPGFTRDGSTCALNHAL